MLTPTLNKCFHDWCVTVFGPHYRERMPQTELTERERAFMSGFACCYMIAMEAAHSDEAEATRRVRAVEEEIKTYFAAFTRMPREPRAN